MRSFRPGRAAVPVGGGHGAPGCCGPFSLVVASRQPNPGKADPCQEGCADSWAALALLECQAPRVSGAPRHGGGVFPAAAGTGCRAPATKNAARLFSRGPGGRKSEVRVWVGPRSLCRLPGRTFLASSSFWWLWRPLGCGHLLLLPVFPRPSLRLLLRLESPFSCRIWGLPGSFWTISLVQAFH